MDDKYYGNTISPNENFLIHYGIRGMKWGVRKAIKNRNDVALSKQYAKAYKKLRKLNEKADINKQRNIAKKYGRIATISGSIGASAAGASIGAHHLQNRNWNNFGSKVNDLYNKFHPHPGNGRWQLTPSSEQKFVSENALAKAYHKQHLDVHNKLNTAKYITGGIGAAGLAVGAATGARALIAKRRTTTGGHAAAVARRNEFQREMNKAFAGTKYANGRSASTSKKRRGSRRG